MKRFFCVFLTILMTISVGAAPVFATEADAEAGEVSVLAVRGHWTTLRLTVSYDDRFDLAELCGIEDGSEYSIYRIENETITSMQVSQGRVTGEPDSALITQLGGTRVIATGVGEADVYLVRTEDLADGAEPSGGYRITLTVEPAVLTLMFLTGQSNMLGMSSDATGYDRGSSVACTEGTVYSTLAISDPSSGYNVSGVSFSSACTAANAGSFVAGSLQGDTDLYGEPLAYPLNNLTGGGNGKTGPDSGLAYEWNRLTGDKIWVVNTASENSDIADWVPGGGGYERSAAVWNCVLQTAEAEIWANHYTAGKKLIFWQQGETADAMYLTAADYEAEFSSMYSAMCGVLGESDVPFGIITARAGYGEADRDYLTGKDLYMTGPRIAQYWLGSGSSPYPNVYVVSNANEQWVSEEGVISWFRSAYPGGSLSYPMQNAAQSASLPASVAAVHGDMHYSQIGHNENGITAADGMYAALGYGSGSGSFGISWKNGDGQAVSSLALSVSSGAAVAVPVADPVYLTKQVTCSVSDLAISYNAASGTVSGSSPAVKGEYGIFASGGGLSDAFLTVTVNADADLSSVAGPDYTGLYKYNGTWWYLENGVIRGDYEGVVKNRYGWWYVKDGTVDFTYTGFAKNEYGWWYIENGKVTFEKNSVIRDTGRRISGSADWWYVVESRVQTGFTGLADYGNEHGWWYIRDGAVDFTANTVAKNKNGWWYVTDGRVQFDFTGLADYGNANGWWYIRDGAVDFTANTVAKNKNGWWYVTDGRVQFDFTGLADYGNAYGWWYIRDGAVDFTANTVAKNKNGWWYVTDGRVQFDFTGLADYRNAYGWWYIRNGAVDFTANTVAKNKNGWWYVEDGKVDFTFNGIARNEYGWWYIRDGKVDFTFTGTVSAGGVKYSVEDGRVYK